MKNMSMKEKVAEKLEKMTENVMERTMCGLLYGEVEIPQSLKDDYSKKHQK